MAERYISVRSLIASAPEAMHPVTRQIILGGAHPSAVDAFKAFYQLEELRRVRDHTFGEIDVLALPTVPTVYTVAQVLADPIGLNSRLGTYTNFVNLLDLCALAVPASMQATPFGITLLAQAGNDATLASLGRVFHAGTGLPLGATGTAQPALAPLPALPPPARSPSRWSARISPACRSTASSSRSARASWNGPRRPRTIACSCCRARRRRNPGCCGSAPMPAWPSTSKSGRCRRSNSDALSRRSPPRSSIGTLTITDGRDVKGFLVEAEATRDARDISAFGGWRNFMEQMKVSA